MVAGSRASGHVAEPEPTSAERFGPEPLECGNARAHLSSEAGSRAVGHVIALEPISAGRHGLEL
jgi:hypothetical protein